MRGIVAIIGLGVEALSDQGALHLPGDRGILHLLEQMGYEVTAVY